MKLGRTPTRIFTALLILWAIVAAGWIVFQGNPYSYWAVRKREQAARLIQVEPDLLTGVIRIESHDPDRPYHSFGSGVIVARRGVWYYVATAAHVVDEGNCTVGDERIELEILYEDAERDLAIGRFRDWQKRRVFELVDAKLGESCRSHGWYGWFDGEGNVTDATRIVFQGHVSCIDWKDFVTTDSGVHPGCSGGPLLNTSNQVLGILSHVPGWGMGPNPTVGICIPTSEIQRALNEVLKGK